MTRILFADDEIPVLEGLRTRLYRQSGRWSMVFVESGSRAIAELERHPYDVIVTDMRMPGMDGAELLQIVSERWPQTVRIVLSGYAQPEQALRLVPVAHQYLSKPCDAQRLVGAIDRCVELQGLLPRPDLRALAGRICTLPVMPGGFAKLRSMVSSESPSIEEVAELVATDPLISAKVLQMANSAFFRLARPIINIDQATQYLGIAAIRSLVTSAFVFAPWAGDRGAAHFINFEELQSHAHAVATAAHALVSPSPLADESLVAGLLHDIGYLLLAHQCPDRLADAVHLARAERIPLNDAEMRVIGASHAQLGAYLLGIWGLPPSVVAAVAHHHSPHDALKSKFEPVAAVVVAHALLPTDDTSAFGPGLAPDRKIDPPMLNAPFDWAEAVQRVAKIFDSEEVVV